MAKLVEILARDLSEWPHEAASIAQDHDSCAHPYNSSEIELNHGEWGGKDAEVMVSSYNVRIGERAEDYATAIVTRAEWQAAVDALKAKDIASSTAAMIDAGWIEPKPPVSPSLHAQVAGRANRIPEWDGVGLPPSGTICELRNVSAGTEWARATVVFASRNVVVWDWAGEPAINGLCTAYAHAVEIRPIRTPEQIAEEERREGIAGIAEDLGNKTWGVTIQEWLYDLGYRKQEQK